MVYSLAFGLDLVSHGGFCGHYKTPYLQVPDVLWLGRGTLDTHDSGCRELTELNPDNGSPPHHP